MPDTPADDPDAQAIAYVRYVLTTAGWLIDEITLTPTGPRLIAHRQTRRGRFLTKPGFSEIEE